MSANAERGTATTVPPYVGRRNAELAMRDTAQVLVGLRQVVTLFEQNAPSVFLFREVA